MKTVDKALNDLILHFEHHFCKTAESLTPKQLSFLQALVEERSKLCSAATREAYQLGSSSNVARIKQSLANKGIIEIGSNVNTFADPVFREWLRICHFKTHSVPYFEATGGIAQDDA